MWKHKYYCPFCKQYKGPADVVRAFVDRKLYRYCLDCMGPVMKVRLVIWDVLEDIILLIVKKGGEERFR